MTPARTASSGNRVPQGKSNFGLLLFAMIASTRTDLLEIRSRVTSSLFFVDRLVLFPAAKCKKRACNRPTSNSREREEIARGWQQCLHRAIIDTSSVSPMARKLEAKEQRLPSTERLRGCPSHPSLS